LALETSHNIIAKAGLTKEDFIMNKKPNRMFHPLLVLVLAGSIGMTGCGTTTSQPPANPSAESTQTTQSATDIKAKVNEMLTVAKELQQHLDAGDEAKVKATAPKLEDTWASFEDQVKPKYPDDYEKVEQSLDPTVAGAKASPLDKAALAKWNQQLIDTLNNLEQKIK
jgi:iron uptake system EfeUOB component EfeO/EfeM